MPPLLIPIVLLIVGMTVLIWSADRFVDGAAGLSRNLGLSPLLVGMLVVGFGTSAPELLVSATAALDGNAGLGMGNAIGSNITNIALVLGVTAIIVKLPVQSDTVRIEIPIIFVSGLVALILIAHDGIFSRGDGLFLFVSLFFVMGYITYRAMNPKRPPAHIAPEAEEQLPDELPLKLSIFWTIAGLVILVLSSKVLVWSATEIAIHFGISDLIIGLTIVAIGTSLPELAASISCALKNKIDFAVGTIVGSNIFNTLGVLALPGMIAGVEVLPDGVLIDMTIMLAITLLLLVFVLYSCFIQRNCVRGGNDDKSTSFTINRGEGITLVAVFIAYEIYLYTRATAG